MNNRIQELAEQCYHRYSEHHIDLEKFAELIVKDCISVPYAMWDRAELNADIALKIENRIRDHFWMFEE